MTEMKESIPKVSAFPHEFAPKSLKTLLLACVERGHDKSFYISKRSYLFTRRSKYILNLITSRTVLQQIRKCYQAIFRLLRAKSLQYTYPCMCEGTVPPSKTACRVHHLFHNNACGQKVRSLTSAPMLRIFWRPEFRNNSEA